jgi:hypothetical protein
LQNPPQALIVEHDQMVGTLAPDRPNQAFNMAVERNDVGVPNAHRLDAA